MNRAEFWEIIERIKEEDDRCDALSSELEQLNAEEITAWQEQFDECFNEANSWSLWGAAYVIGGGCSDDGFIDFRYGLISLGEDVFEAALLNPDTLASLDTDIEIDNELFGYIATEVFETKTGDEMPRKPMEGSGEPSGVEWDFDSESLNREKMPELVAAYW